MAERSVFVPGNFARFERVWERLERGEPARIAVVVLGMCGQSMGNSQRTDGEVARHYDLPFVSWRDALRPCMDAGMLTWRDVSPDTRSSEGKRAK